eukprot:scaffold11144_cov111-Isochrysis_galbana.AAC.10
MYHAPPPHTAHRTHQPTLGALSWPTYIAERRLHLHLSNAVRVHLHAAVIAAPGICAVCCEPGS